MGCNLNAKYAASFQAFCKRAELFVAVVFFAPLIALSAPGDLDPTFGHLGLQVNRYDPYNFSSVVSATLPNGKIIVAAQCGSQLGFGICVMRWLPSGEIDTAYGENGIVYRGGHTNTGLSLLLKSDGSAVVGASCAVNFAWQFCLFGFDSVGAIDAGFGENGKIVTPVVGFSDQLKALAIDKNGDLIAAGDCQRDDGPVSPEVCVARFSATGLRDVTFGGATGYALGSTSPYEVYVQSAKALSDGSVLVLAQCWHASTARVCMFKYDKFGAPVTSFGLMGASMLEAVDGVLNEEAKAFAVLTDERVVFFSDCITALGGAYCARRLSSSGATDQTFGVLGQAKVFPSSYVDIRPSGSRSILEVESGKLQLGGTCISRIVWYPGGNGAGVRGYCMVRLTSDGVVDETFGSNGVTQIETTPEVGDMTGLFRVNDGKLIVSGTCDLPNVFPNRNQLCSFRTKGGPYDAATCSLNADLNSQVAGNDGALAIRYLLGYTGNALTDSALGANPGRTAQQIEEHFAQLKTDGKLDVDGDGEVNAMTDGLLILRAMLGLSGDALVVGARNASHPNVRDAKQILTWIEATHGVACLP
jgi:uncharacterized delta-60 repeat protein